MLIIWCDVTQLIGPLIVPDPVLGKIASYRLWFEKRLGDAIQAADAKQAIDLQPMPNDEYFKVVVNSMPKDLMSLVTQWLKCITKKRCKLTTLGNIRTCLTFWPLRFHTFFRWSTPHNHRQAFRANFLLHKKHFIEQVFVVNYNHRALCFKY